MDNKLASANKVISGTWGEVWLGGDYVGECYGMSAKVAYNKDVALCGRMVTDKKITSIACTESSPSTRSTAAWQTRSRRTPERHRQPVHGRLEALRS